MVITRTPYRISFFGGGTDYPAWFENNGGGAVLATAVNKYCYLNCRYLPPFFDHKSRVVWSRIENINHVDEVAHPSVRETLKFLGISEGFAVHHDGDLPARTGIGSSSSFTVGLLHALYALQGKLVSKHQLAMDAIHIEQERLKEKVGCQDQVIAAFGGFNRIDFGGIHKIRVQPITISQERLNRLQDHLMLFFTGISRTASEVAAEQIRNIPSKIQELHAMRAMVDEGIAVLTGPGDLEAFGRLLNTAWQHKRSLTSQISNSHIDAIYQTAQKAGALGGKLLGAGGGGFLLLFVRPEQQEQMKTALNGLLHVPFRFESNGSQIIYYGPTANF